MIAKACISEFMLSNMALFQVAGGTHRSGTHIPVDKGAFHFTTEQPRIHLLQTPITLSKGVIQFSCASLPWGGPFKGHRYC